MTKATKSGSIEERIYPEMQAGLYSHRDCTVAFYGRIDALLDPTMTVLNLGAGRGANIVTDRSPYRRKLQTFKGRAAKVIGIDLDPVVKENEDLDEALTFELGGRWPVDDETIDLIVSDHVLEHVDDPQQLSTEAYRVLKPGGWFCARTPVKWGYIGIAARAVPNSLHVRMLKKLQPSRQAMDVFPVRYLLNTKSDLKRTFPADRWRNCTYGFNGVPGYHANNRVLFNLVELWGRLMPNSFSAKFHVFLQKR